MNKIKLNTHSLNQFNKDRLLTYYKFHKVKPDSDGYITPSITVLIILVSFSKLNSNAAKILEDNEELIAAILSERELNNSDKTLIAYAKSPFIASIIALTT